MALPAIADSATPELRSVETLHAIRLWIATAQDDAEVRDIYHQAELARQWVRIHREAVALAVEASRLELVALRRLGQLRALGSLGSQRASAARGLAELAEPDFERLLASVAEDTSAVAVWRRYKQALEEQQGVRIGYAIGSGQSAAPEEVTSEELSDATEAVLAAAFADGRPTSVTGAALSVAEILGLEDSFVENSAVRRGLRAAVRYSLAQANSAAEGDYPRFVTYRDKEVGWVRVPFHCASVAQVRAWASFRMRQARDTATAASYAETIAALVNAAPDDANVADVLGLHGVADDRP